MDNKPINLADLINVKLLEPAKLTPQEVKYFIEDVNREMKQLGYNTANELTRRSEIMTEEDYQTYINC